MNPLLIRFGHTASPQRITSFSLPHRALEASIPTPRIFSQHNVPPNLSDFTFVSPPSVANSPPSPKGEKSSKEVFTDFDSFDNLFSSLKAKGQLKKAVKLMKNLERSSELTEGQKLYAFNSLLYHCNDALDIESQLQVSSWLQKRNKN
eukprot:TRINITY_DN8762_c0_g1_i1.p1 TRINITY_DN8762_c0_g1~~TRINITY_DN8762_c0_g1_i1.p1  ORF type:complete len:148 (-),score=32.36 TRINITY_DN8762_c0_g1_i1:222-665(-)